MRSRYLGNSYSKYMIAASMVLYTFLAYVALPSGKDVRRTCETLQRLCLGVFTINAYLTMAILAGDEYIFTFGILQLLIVLGASLLYRTLYKSANMLMINNIMMLLSIGLVMITRINQAKAQKQLLISLAGMVFLMVIPLLRTLCVRELIFTGSWESRRWARYCCWARLRTAPRSVSLLPE